MKECYTVSYSYDYTLKSGKVVKRISDHYFETLEEAQQFRDKLIAEGKEIVDDCCECILF